MRAPARDATTHALPDFARPPRPATSYEAAFERFEDLLRSDTDVVDPQSRARLYSPGHRTQRAIVFFHGLTNSPRQFELLAQRFVARGYTVFVPRLPYHGYADRMSTDQANLSVTDLVEFTAASMDLAAGLADDVTASGISLGGVLAVWAGQCRPIALAAPIAPAFGLPVLPYATTSVLFRAVGRLPNRFVWWDPRKREQLPGPEYAYPRFATHALVATQNLGWALIKKARTERPCAQRILMISNASDRAVSNAAADKLVRRWREAGAANVRTFRFPRQMKLFHDLVDPLQPGARPDVVHPMLEQLIVDGTVPKIEAVSGRAPQST
jgi:alpha-beta hydrolase superfamily lysophospholipase